LTRVSHYPACFALFVSDRAAWAYPRVHRGESRIRHNRSI